MTTSEVTIPAGPATDPLLTYTEALEAGDITQAFAKLHTEGPYFDKPQNAWIVGDAANTYRLLHDPGTSNALSVTPNWFKGPWSLSLKAFKPMIRVIRHRKAMQSLDGLEHQTVRAVVDEAFEDIRALDEHKRLLHALVDREAAQVTNHLYPEAGPARPFDVVASLRRVRMAQLEAEAGYPHEYGRQVMDTTARQMRFLWGWPWAKRQEHRDLAMPVRATFDACAEVVKAHISHVKEGTPLPVGVVNQLPITLAGRLAQAVVAGKISKKVAYSTYFGVMNAGEGTASGTGANIANELVKTGDWNVLAEGGNERAIIEKVNSLVEPQSAVKAWQKGVKMFHKLRLQDPEGNPVVIPGGSRVLLVLAAAYADPNANVRVSHFSGGPHECPGRVLTYDYLRRYFSKIIPLAPNIEAVPQPSGEQAGRTTTFSAIGKLAIRPIQQPAAA